MESEQTLVALAEILGLGIACQWIAERLRVPSILLLLLAGVLVGPVTGHLNPDQLLNHLLMPLVALSIAVILFEGAMTLRLSDLTHIGRPLLMLLSVAVAITWFLGALAAHYILLMGWTDSVLLGALLTVTGPTVVSPLLSHIRPIGNVAALARWEGIVIDPVGAVLAVLTFAAIQEARVGTFSDTAIGFLLTFLVGTVTGLIAAAILFIVLKKHWVSDHLDSPLVLGFVVVTFTIANRIQHEAGLVSVTVMGVALANQKSVSVSRILAFKEHLTVLLISSLFIVLTARLNLQSFVDLGLRGVLFVVALVLVIRPASVMMATIGCKMKMNERLFLSWLAPRGIVAAAVGSVFAAEMAEDRGRFAAEMGKDGGRFVAEMGEDGGRFVAEMAEDGGRFVAKRREDGRRFVAAVFLVVVGTVFVYGLSASAVARKLGLSVADPQGILIVSAHAGARAIAAALQKEGFHVRVVDTNRDNISAARMEGLPTYFGNVLSEQLEEVDLGGLGRIIAMTGNAEVNLLAMHRGEELFERKECYRLALPSTGASRSELGREARAGRILFSEESTYQELDRRFEAGHKLKATLVTEEFSYRDFLSQHLGALPMFVISASRKLTVVTTQDFVEPQPGQTVMALVPQQEAVSSA